MVDRQKLGANLVRGVIAVGALIATATLSFGATTVIRSTLPRTRVEPRDSASEAERNRRAFPSGRYLVAYVLLSHRCGFCAEKGTRNALSGVRASLKKYEGRQYAKVSVIGIALDEDLEGGLKYLKSLNRSDRAFDELSVGGSWLNHLIGELVWRDGLANAATPTVLLTEHGVDASAYPTHIEIQRDSLIFNVVGRDRLIDWVARGTPLTDIALPSAVPLSALPSKSDPR